jgi:hypothetical protein
MQETHPGMLPVVPVTNTSTFVCVGASEGKGLGNKFLDDLRQADILLHIIDVSGTTNEKVPATLAAQRRHPTLRTTAFTRFHHAFIRAKQQRAMIRSTTSNGSTAKSMRISSWSWRLSRLIVCLQYLSFTQLDFQQSLDPMAQHHTPTRRHKCALLTLRHVRASVCEGER